MHRRTTPDKLNRLRANARHYVIWRWPTLPERGDKVQRINKAETADELRAIVGASSHDLQTFILRYGLY